MSITMGKIIFFRDYDIYFVIEKYNFVYSIYEFQNKYTKKAD